MLTDWATIAVPVGCFLVGAAGYLYNMALSKHIDTQLSALNDSVEPSSNNASIENIDGATRVETEWLRLFARAQLSAQNVKSEKPEFIDALLAGRSYVAHDFVQPKTKLFDELVARILAKEVLARDEREAGRPPRKFSTDS